MNQWVTPSRPSAKMISKHKSNKTPPLLGSIVVGVIAAVLIFAATPFWLLGQIGGPILFVWVWFPITIPSLVVSIIMYRPRSVYHAIGCGLGYSLPVAIICFLLPRWYAPHVNPFTAEVRTLAWITLVLSPVSMVAAVFIRHNRSTAH